ncbi:alcohol dehydrogenase catalytic domain-containing protein [Rubellimicrobium rubrum]|uniref:alcohol dehydrogenase catalytic domain-containing protein n=1 Tax=Rubellimicrobium rubrum TaxID=2585369 RepID=UPI001FE36514|nr:alcohol dehydrogenase catalytic domain-containing protein [Rubellimicrobium rubrum]
MKPGHILGKEYSGELVDAGTRSRWRLADQVIAPFTLACGECPCCLAGESTTWVDQVIPGFTTQGAFAEYVSVPRDHNLTPSPVRLSPDLVAGLGCRASTAWHVLTGRTASKPGEWLAVHGPGLLVVLGQATSAASGL